MIDRIKKKSIRETEETKLSLFSNKEDGLSFLLNENNITADSEKKNRIEIIQRFASLGIFAGGIIHDFNNILSPISGSIQLLLLDIPEGHPYRENLNKIYAWTHQAIALINQITSFSRQKDDELVPVKLQNCIKEVLSLIGSSAPNKVKIIQDIDTCCHSIKANQTQIFQIIINLVINAYHAMEGTGGELRISLQEVNLKKELLRPDMEPGIYACLAVADTGIGIEKKIFKKIFTALFTTKKNGTGLGLSVTNDIVTKLNGVITVHSDRNTGTIMFVYLPVIQSELK